MNAWMNNFIQAQANSRMGSLGDFAKALGGALEQEMFPHEKNFGSLVHIAGYVEEAGKSHPEFWFLRNVHGIDKTTGEYQNIDQHFELSEDFWTRDSLNSAIIEAFQQADYINGFASGRIGFVAVRLVIDQFLDAIWSPPEWNFRPPKSINETKILIRMYMQIINSVFQLSDYSAPFIGGDIQTYLIPQPMNSVTSR